MSDIDDGGYVMANNDVMVLSRGKSRDPQEVKEVTTLKGKWKFFRRKRTVDDAIVDGIDSGRGADVSRTRKGTFSMLIKLFDSMLVIKPEISREHSERYHLDPASPNHQDDED